MKLKFYQNTRSSEEHHEKEKEKSSAPIITTDNQETRIVGLYGEIDEPRCAGVIASLYSLYESGKLLVPVDPEKPEGDAEMVIEPIDFILSTEGGSVSDMFSIYDVIRDLDSRGCDITTFGIGKVMSAGVLLLAAGKHGHRRVGKHCRLMLHPVSSGDYGHLQDLEVSYKEADFLQNLYLEELCARSVGKITKKKLQTIFKKKTDTYFSPQQAVEWGIADIIV